RVPAAVLLSDDGRDGGVHAAERGGDGDAGGQRDDDDRVDPAGGDGQGAAVCDSGGGADGGGRGGGGDRGVAHARHHLARLHGMSAAELHHDQEQADPSGPHGDQEVLQVVPKARAAQGVEVARERRREARYIRRRVALTARAPDSKSGGWGFESLPACQFAAVRAQSRPRNERTWSSSSASSSSFARCWASSAGSPGRTGPRSSTPPRWCWPWWGSSRCFSPRWAGGSPGSWVGCCDGARAREGGAGEVGGGSTAPERRF